MEELFSISQAAKMASMTSETLRHYDRIGLVKPSRKDPESGYRYYTRPDIVRLNTVHALSRMDLSLREIREVLEYEDLSKIIAFLEQAEHRADEKIRELEYGKAKLRSARAAYEEKLGRCSIRQSTYLLELPQRVILPSDTMEAPTLENLWNYLSHFYQSLPGDKREDFEFEDLAGIYTGQGPSRMFAQCARYGSDPRLKILPAGTYLCADCSEEARPAVLRSLMEQARRGFHTQPPFSVQLIVISGILHWNYRIQVPIDCREREETP